LRGAELLLGAVERGLADVGLPEQLLLALEVARGRLQRGACGLHLRGAGRGGLLGRARIQAQQDLAGLDGVTGLHVERHHGARHLGGDHRLAQRLHDAVEGRAVGHAAGPHGRARQVGRAGRLHRPDHDQRAHERRARDPGERREPATGRTRCAAARPALAEPGADNRHLNSPARPDGHPRPLNVLLTNQLNSQVRD
jgi:hypothetical protein